VGAFLGLLLGLGLLLMWHGATARPTVSRPRVRSERTREHLIQAGLPGVSPAQLIALQVLSALLVGVLCVALTASISVSAVFAVFAAAVPRLWVSRLRHKRQADLRELWPEVVDNLTSGVRAGLSLPRSTLGATIATGRAATAGENKRWSALTPRCSSATGGRLSLSSVMAMKSYGTTAGCSIVIACA